MKKFLFTSAVILMLAVGTRALANSVDNVLEKAHSVSDVTQARAESFELLGSTERETQAQGDGVNHGHCVSYWSHQAKDAGLKGKARGEFMSTLAQNKDAVSKKVEDEASPDATCDFRAALEAAKAEASTAQTTEHGKSQQHKGQGKNKKNDS